MGDDPPVGPRVGDLWIQTFDISLQPPAAPTGLVVSATAPTTVTLDLERLGPDRGDRPGSQVERSPNGSTGWVNILTDTTAPYATTVTDSGLAERTTYFYRVRASNTTGQGVYGIDLGRHHQRSAQRSGRPLGVEHLVDRLPPRTGRPSPAPANDPMHATPYEVFRNGVSLGFTASLF